MNSVCPLPSGRYLEVEWSCQVQENCRGNSRNSGHQVWTYEMSEGTLASAYVLRPFQTLVPRFQNREDRRLEIGDWRIGGLE